MNQGSPEWLSSRCGLVTASRINDVMSTIKSGESASRRGYRAQLVSERLTGQPTKSFTNDAMQWGTETEPFARAAYEIDQDTTVDEVGLILHQSIAMSGASPDGLIGKDGLIEIKCPNTATHIEYAVNGVAPKQYQNQMLWQMACTGRAWCDFVSFDPRMPELMRMFVVRFHRDDARIEEIEKEVIKFIGEIESDIEALNNVFSRKAA